MATGLPHQPANPSQVVGQVKLGMVRSVSSTGRNVDDVAAVVLSYRESL